MANYKYTIDGLPIITKKLADSHISEMKKAEKQNELGPLFFKWQTQIRKEQSVLADYVVCLSENVYTYNNKTEKIRLIGYQYGISDIFYLLRKGSNKPLPKLSRPWLFSSPTKIINNSIEIVVNQELMHYISKENPYLIYYNNKKYKDDLNSKDSLREENALYTSEGFFKGYLLFKEEAQHNKNTVKNHQSPLANFVDGSL